MVSRLLEDPKALVARMFKMRQVLLDSDEHEACSFVQCRDWRGLREWAEEKEAGEVRGSATILGVGGDGRGGIA